MKGEAWTGRLRAGAFALAAALLAWGCPGDQGGLPEILGEVNNEYLTTDEFMHHFKVRGGMELEGKARQVFKRWLVAELVDRKLLLQEAWRRRIRPSRSAVRSSFVEMGESGWSQAEKDAAWNIQDEMYEQKQIEILLLNAARPSKRPSEEEVLAYYRKNRSEFRRPEQVRLRQIVVNSASMVDGIRAELEAGRSFSDVQHRHAAAAEAAEKGQLAWLGEADLPTEVWETAREAKRGETAGPVTSPCGVHFLVVRDRRSAGAMSYRDAAADISRRLREERQHEAVTRYVAGLRKRAKIRIDMTALAAL